MDTEAVPIQKDAGRTKTKSAKVKKAFQTDEACFTVLRDLRKQLADERGVPAFIIFGDASLHDMSYRKPKDLQEFATITGVGEKKLKEYGEIFIRAIGQHDEPEPKTTVV